MICIKVIFLKDGRLWEIWEGWEFMGTMGRMGRMGRKDGGMKRGMPNGIPPETLN